MNVCCIHFIDTKKIFAHVCKTISNTVPSCLRCNEVIPFRLMYFKWRGINDNTKPVKVKRK